MAKSIKFKDDVYLDTNSIMHNRKILKDIIYPVGSIYLSVNSTNPSTYFGGTWVQLKDRFLIGVGNTYKTVNATGGASSITLAVANLPSHNHSVGAHSHGLNNHTHTYSRSNDNTNSHTLTIEQMPSHNHIQWDLSWTSAGGWLHYHEGTNYGSSTAHSTKTNSTGGGQGHTHGIERSNQKTGSSSGNTANSSSFNSGSTGSGTAFNIIPPYLAVYMWKRTA